MDFGIFSERLKDLIFDTGKTPRDVAHDIGISKTSLYEYLSGCKTPTLNNLIKIANFFNCSCDYLFGFEDFAENEIFAEVKPFHIRFQEVLKHLDISRYKLEKLTGISESEIALATTSSLKAQRSSIEPPPRPVMIKSATCFQLAHRIAAAISSAAPSPCTRTGRT